MHRSLVRPPSPSNPLMRALKTLAVIVGFVLLVAAIAALFVSRQQDPISVPQLAQVEAEAQLAGAGETMELSVPAFRRRWWDYFQPTRGVLVASERRLVFVGLVPEPLGRTPSGEPPPIERLSFGIDSAVLELQRPSGRGTRTLEVSHADGRSERFSVHSRAAARAESLIVLIGAMQRQREEELETARIAREEADAAARRAIYHRVQPGEALISIAARYGLTPDSLQRLNDLQGTRIRVGDSLLVRPEIARDASP